MNTATSVQGQKKQSIRVECICGEQKPHGQICWLRVEAEFPLPNNDEQDIETESLIREIPICRTCFKKLIQARYDNGRRQKKTITAEKQLLGLLRRQQPIDDANDESDPGLIDLIASLVVSLPKMSQAELQAETFSIKNAEPVIDGNTGE